MDTRTLKLKDIHMRQPILSLIAGLLLFSCTTSKNSGLKNINPYNYSITKKIEAQRGAVASAHPLASQVGVEIMRKGGNAFDAVIATQLALAVVYPNAGNIGGGGFLVARRADGSLISLDYREAGPAAAHRDMYLDAQDNVIPNKSLRGHLASGIPGTIAGLFETIQYAKLPFRQLVQPAIELAEKGFVISEREARSLNGLQEDLRLYNTAPNAFQKTIPWITGDTLIQKDLANTLKRVREQGAAGFYEGETARLITEEMKRGKGIISQQDLKNYKAKWRTPHQFTYRGYQIVSMPMPSSGGVLIHQMLKMIEDKPMASYGFHSAQAVQLMAEAERRAYSDRARYMGDADFYKVPVNELVSEAYLKNRMKDYNPSMASKSESIKPGAIPGYQSEETTHISVIDKEGNAIAVTTTLNDSYGSKTVVGGAGFLLNNEMDDFSVKPGVPNMYGAIGGEANAIAPGKRMLSSMTPTLVLQNNKPYLVIGTPGGTTIPTSVFQTIVNVIDFGLSTDDAVNKAKFHHQWLPDQIEIEKTFPFPVREQLQKMGYKLNERTAIGRTEVIRVLPNGRFEAVADSRGDDAAAGY
jgi:gamma-glutamyltranspeptidase/glutathione hydrolase